MYMHMYVKMPVVGAGRRAFGSTAVIVARPLLGYASPLLLLFQRIMHCRVDKNR